MATEKLVERILGLAALALLAGACFLVLRPFVSSLLLAAILCYATWPLYSRLERATGGHRTLAASLMTALVALVLIAPFSVVVATLADNVTILAGQIRELFESGPPAPPSWLAGIPVLGPSAAAYWQELAVGSRDLLGELQRFAGPATEFALGAGAAIGTGLFELALSVFIAFFLFRSGRESARQLAIAVERFAGERTHHLLDVAGWTVIGVVYGILGTALAQGILAGLGLWIAGVPGALLLGFVTFVLSMVPMAPPLVWLPATIWLLARDQLGWGIFMGLWGFFVISGVDNVLKPYLIARGSALPLVPVFLGAIGGILAFGFIGIFLGPTLLALGYSLVRDWTAQAAAAAVAGDGAPPPDAPAAVVPPAAVQSGRGGRFTAS